MILILYIVFEVARNVNPRVQNFSKFKFRGQLFSWGRRFELKERNFYFDFEFLIAKHKPQGDLAYKVFQLGG